MASTDFLEEKLDVLAIAAHRDDIELSCGGTITRLRNLGYAVGIADLTAGEMGTRGSAEERAAEAEAAARVMGISYRVNLGLPDGDIQPTAEANDALIRLIRATRPTMLLAPYPEDRHPDHAMTGRIVPEAAFRAGLRRWDTGQPYHRPLVIIHYMAHYEFVPSFVVDITDQWPTKIEAVRCYRSQVSVPGAPKSEPSKGDAPTYISSPEFFGRLEVRARHWGAKIAATYGEAFFYREMLRIDDPMVLASGSIERFAMRRSDG